MNAVTPFSFDGADVRVVTINGAPGFIGKDVAERLGYADTTNALKQHCRGVVKHHPIVDNLGRTQRARVLSEPDVLRLIMGSKLPAAERFERFERWVFEAVLPSIRKTGAYNTPAADAELVRRTDGIVRSMKHDMAVQGRAISQLMAVVTKQSEQIETLVIAHNPRIAVAEYVSPLDILKVKHIPAHGRRGIVRFVGNRVAKWCKANGIEWRKDTAGKRVFPCWAMAEWLRAEGDVLIDHARHARKISQGIMEFRKGKAA